MKMKPLLFDGRKVYSPPMLSVKSFDIRTCIMEVSAQINDGEPEPEEEVVLGYGDDVERDDSWNEIFGK